MLSGSMYVSGMSTVISSWLSRGELIRRWSREVSRGRILGRRAERRPLAIDGCVGGLGGKALQQSSFSSSSLTAQLLWHNNLSTVLVRAWRSSWEAGRVQCFLTALIRRRLFLHSGGTETRRYWLVAVPRRRFKELHHVEPSRRACSDL